LEKRFSGRCERVAELAYLTFQFIYPWLIILHLIQVGRLLRGGVSFSYPLLQHSLFAVVSIIRLMECFNFSYTAYFIGDASNTPDVYSAILASLPYCLMFWGYTLSCFQWMATHYFAMSLKGNSFQAVKPAFIISNVIITGLSFALFLTLAISNNATTRRNIMISGTSIMAFTTFMTGTGIAVYGGHITKALSNHPSSGLAKKMYSVSCGFAIAFIGESIFWIGSAVIDFEGLAANLITGLYLSFDVMAMCVIFYLFDAVVSKESATNKTSSKPQGGSHAKSSQKAANSTVNHSGANSVQMSQIDDSDAVYTTNPLQDSSSRA